MPIFEFFCATCGFEEEVLVRTAADRERSCATCGHALERKVSLPGTVIFNGTGYYTTDYKRKEGGGSKPAPARNGKPDPADGGTKESGTKDGGTKESGTKESGTPPAAPASGGAPQPVPAPAGEKRA